MASEWLAGGAVSALRIAGALLSLLLMALISNQLGPEGAGRFYLSLTWATIIAMAANWGAPGVILVVLAPVARDWRKVFAASLLSRFLVSGLIRLALILGLLAITLIAFRQFLASVDPLFALAVALFLLIQQQLASAAKALHRPVAASALEFCLVPAFAAIAWLALASATGRHQPGVFADFYVAGIALSAGLLAWIAAKQLGFSRPATGKAARTYASRAHSFAHAELALYLTNWGALLLTPLFLTQGDVGLLNAALRIAGTIALFSIVITVLIPRLALAQKVGDMAEFARLNRSVWLLMAVSATALFAGMVLVGPLILRVMGEGFEAAYRPLLIASVGYCAALALGPVIAVLIVQGREALVRDVTVAVGLATLLASTPAILVFGLDGAAAVTGLGAFAQKFVLLLCVARGKGQRDKHVE